MSNRFFTLLNRQFPQNYIIRKPLFGAPFVSFFCFVFAVLYHPEFTRYGEYSHAVTMGIYCFSIGLILIPLIALLKQIPFFSGKQEWTFIKEISIEVVILFLMGVYVYFMAFIVEPPADRWNFDSFSDSIINTFRIGVLPYLFFSVLNYKHLLPDYKSANSETVNDKTEEFKIEIDSTLKKDNLSFLPSEFLYAESNGNYVSFYLNQNDKIRKKTIRNSMSNVEEQLSDIEYFVRSHRAFIVNLKMVTQKQGNASGYRLSMKGVSIELPVSRQNVAFFDKKYEQICLCNNDISN